MYAVQLFEKEEVPHDIDPERHNHCRDTLCILIFGAFWAFLIAVFLFAWTTGDVNRLVYPLLRSSGCGLSLLHRIGLGYTLLMGECEGGLGGRE